MATIRGRLKADGSEVWEVQVRIRGFEPRTASFKRKTDAKQWAAIAKRAGWQMLRMNLNTFDRQCVFAIPGMGRLAFEAVSGRDPALLMGVVFTSTLLVLAMNLLADLALTRLDPRIGAADA